MTKPRWICRHPGCEFAACFGDDCAKHMGMTSVGDDPKKKKSVAEVRKWCQRHGKMELASRFDRMPSGKLQRSCRAALEVVQ